MVHHRNGHQVSIGHQVSLSHIRGFLGLRQERDSRRPVVLNDAGERRGVNHDHCKIKKDMTSIYIYDTLYICTCTMDVTWYAKLCWANRN